MSVINIEIKNTINIILQEWPKYQSVFDHYFKLNSRKQMTIDNVMSMVSLDFVANESFLIPNRQYLKSRLGMFITKNGKRVCDYVLIKKQKLSPVDLWSLMWQSINGAPGSSPELSKRYGKDLMRVKQHLGLVKTAISKPSVQRKRSNKDDSHAQFMFERNLIKTPMKD